MPVPLLHNLKHNKVLHERVVLLHVVTENIPRVAPQHRVEVVHLGSDFHSVVRSTASWSSRMCRRHWKIVGHTNSYFADDGHILFFVGSVTIVAHTIAHSSIKRRLFEAMHRNALAATEFFQIPPNRVVELGGQVEL